MQKSLILLLILALIQYGCTENSDNSIASSPEEIPFTWNNANVYFLLTDRFNNSDPSNDVHFNRNKQTAVNRGFQGGDLAGITQKIEEGYFNELGVSAIWMTPFHEQIHGMVDEGTGSTYGYHGYWIRDWTALDPNFGTEEELAQLVETAHKHGIRVIMDVIVNHTGPVTDIDPLWGDNWVRTGPKCEYRDYRSTVTCTLVENLPDIKTESEQDIALPYHLLQKWESEGRLEEELEELDTFFEETGYPRAPKYYIIKWLTDYVRKYGINGYRLDTAKHTEEGVWAILRKEADRAYSDWKTENPDFIPIEEQFYMVGEVYNYMISGGRWFDFGDTLVDFYEEGIDHLINFEFKQDALNHYEELFSKYASILHNELSGNGVMNYISSHDDSQPFDKNRENPFEAATKLLLCPGATQIYYGDETSRLLFAPGAEGDANLRSFMNWEELEENAEINGIKRQELFNHYSKLGQFRQKHPAVGAGTHQVLSMDPYIFSRSYAHGEKIDAVVVGLDLPTGTKTIPVDGIFENGVELIDNYSGESVTVKKGVVEVTSNESIVLLGKY